MAELEKATGRVIAHRRRRAGLTQETLAEAAEVDVSYISQLERGVKSPTLRTLFRIAAGLGLAPSALLKGIERELAKPPTPSAPAKKARVPRRGGTR